MEFSIRVVKKPDSASSSYRNTVVLTESNWDDYSFKTSFTALYFDPEGKKTDLGTIKIGYKSQQHGWTSEKLPEVLPSLEDGFFSLGQDVEFYKKVQGELSKKTASTVLHALKDLIADPKLLSEVEDEQGDVRQARRGRSHHR